MIPIPKQQRASTGIAGLDDVLGGGFPTNHLYLVEGEPGAGKTTLGLQFLRQGVSQGECGLYVTLSETTAELAVVAASHGWSLDGMSVFELVDADGLGPDAEQSILHPSEMELGETTRGVMAEVERLRPHRVVFDSLSEMRLLAQDPLRYRRQILTLKHFFARRNCTVLLLDDKSHTGSDLQLHSIAHGVLSLSRDIGDYGDDKRYLRIVKLRGSPYRGGEHDFKLTTGGIEAYPRLIASEHRTGFAPASRSSGNAAFDAMLGGGLTYGTNLLFAGASGVGKTSTAMACVAAALQRGEQAAYYLFDEGATTLLARCRVFGMDLQPYIASGQLQLHALDPGQVSPGEFSSLVRDSVEQRGTTVLCIDSLNAYLQAMPGGKFLLLQMHELLNYLNQQGLMTILILSQHGVFGDGGSDVDLSYLSDAIVQFRYFEARGSLLKAVSVIKSRTARHEQTIREFRLGSGGIEVGAALTDFEGVMGGIPTYRGSQPMLSDAEAPAP